MVMPAIDLGSLDVKPGSHPSVKAGTDR